MSRQRGVLEGGPAPPCLSGSLRNSVRGQKALPPPSQGRWPGHGPVGGTKQIQPLGARPSSLIPPTPGSPEARRAMGVSLPREGGGSNDDPSNPAHRASFVVVVPSELCPPSPSHPRPGASWTAMLQSADNELQSNPSESSGKMGRRTRR